MGLDTIGKIKGRVAPVEILNFIRQKYDSEAESGVSVSEYGPMSQYDFVKEHYGDNPNWAIESGFISFTTKNGNRRSLFYFYDNMNSHENMDYYKKYGLEDMVKAEKTHIGLGYNDEAIEIIREIVAYYGGWIDECDCDDEPFYEIQKETDLKIKPVIKVTMKEIEEKFGGTVVIVDR